ncbi:MAG: DUF1385 domain-containing protein [Actinomycetota bacterium]|nr:DUF1385 domain-containing protein [Actinomycetota bacterium]
MGDDASRTNTSGIVEHGEAAPHYYGGQAVIEGVMMRGADTWSVAVRRPSGEIYIERHEVSDFPQRHPMFKRPLVRGVFALFDAMAVGIRALSIAAREAMPEDEQPLDGRALGGSLLLALVFFVGLFIVLPNAALSLASGVLGNGLAYHLVEGVLRIALFLGYLSAIALLSDIRRVFAYHGAEHKTIAAWEHGEKLDPETVDRYSTLHVRCGTNFLIIVMVLALLVYSVAGLVVPAPAGGGWLAAVAYHVVLRIVLLPVVAGLAYEGIRLGATQDHLWIVRALMQPGLWLQRITTRRPTGDQIEVAIRAFEAIVPEPDLAGRTVALPSMVIHGADEATPRRSPLEPRSSDGPCERRSAGATREEPS